MCRSVDLKTAVVSNKQDNDALKAASLKLAKANERELIKLPCDIVCIQIPFILLTE